MADFWSFSLPLYFFWIALISGCITAISLDDFCCLMVSGIIKSFVTSVNRIMHRPIFSMPNVLVKRNNKSMIQPKIPAIGPRIPPVFVKTTAPAKLFKTLPPYGAPAVLVFLRNWIITAFCKGMTAKDPLAGQPCTLKHTIVFQCFNGVLRARRCVNTVSIYFKRGKILLVPPYHQDHCLFYNLHDLLHFDSFKI